MADDLNPNPEQPAHDEIEAEIARLEAEMGSTVAEGGQPAEQVAVDPPLVTEAPVVEPVPEPVITAPHALNGSNSILLEDGNRIPVTDETPYHQWRVMPIDGHYYHHVKDAEDGEWIYRLEQ